MYLYWKQGTGSPLKYNWNKKCGLAWHTFIHTERKSKTAPLHYVGLFNYTKFFDDWYYVKLKNLVVLSQNNGG
jgi:hypothetical protein